MEKSNLLWIALSLVFVVVFNAIVFLTITIFTTTFWVSYGFIHFAYIILVLTLAAMPKVKNSFVLGFPMVYLSFLFFMGALITGVLFMILKNAAIHIAVIPQLIIAGIYAFTYISYLLANENTLAKESQSQNEINYIKNAVMEMKLLMDGAMDPKLKKKLEKLYDSIKSSQVKSHPALSDIELSIMVKIEELREKMPLTDHVEVNSIIDSITRLIAERNNKISLIR